MTMHKAQIRDYEHRLEMIQEEYLQKHFQQVAIVLAKHYHYAFQILKQLYRLAPSQRRDKGKVFFEAVGSIVARRKKTILAYLVRRDGQNQYLKSKACVVLASLLIRKIIGIQVRFIAAISSKDNKQSIPKQQQLFLIIKLSNLNKLLSFAKTDAFHLIKHECILRKQEARKTSLIRLVFVLNNYVSRMIIDSFLAIANTSTVVTAEQSSEDDESVLIETFKAMAVSLNRQPKLKTSPLQQMKKQMAAKLLFSTLQQKQANLLRWSFSDILCLDNHKFRASTLQVLRRQITILEQQYESV